MAIFRCKKKREFGTQSDVTLTCFKFLKSLTSGFMQALQEVGKESRWLLPDFQVFPPPPLSLPPKKKAKITEVYYFQSDDCLATETWNEKPWDLPLP